jgi:phosphoglycolate phosphatase
MKKSVTQRRRRLVLWDIDSTLVDSRGIGLRSILRTVEEFFVPLAAPPLPLPNPHPTSSTKIRAEEGEVVFRNQCVIRTNEGQTNTIITTQVGNRTVISQNGVVFAGRTDPLILRDLLKANNVLLDEEIIQRVQEEFFQRYAEDMQKEVQTILAGSLHDIEATKPRSLPGVQDLLQRLHSEESIVQGIVTGNIRATALIKLQAADIDPTLYFKVGGYGDDVEDGDRNKLPVLALERARHSFGNDFCQDPHDVIVIGDTPKDVECAKVNGFTAVAVATGRYSSADLRNCEPPPDYVLEDLSNVEEVLRILLPPGDSISEGFNNNK